ncbi:MAG: hypothetical protein IKE36_12015 [Solobacterium sp.]|nr:hypothetical protein [Solobacterium sp.]
MAGEIGYYFEHWNTNLFSISVLCCLVLIVSGYFWGKIFQKFFKSLKDVDCTFLGVFWIFAVFQIYSYFAVSWRVSSDIGYYLLLGLILAGPVLCLLTLSNPLPTWKNLFAFLTGIGIAAVLGYASAQLNTNNIFFDSVYYMSDVIENSTHAFFGGVDYYHGDLFGYYAFDKLHGTESFYYIFAMILRWVRVLFDYKESLTPVYIWSASLLYYMSLGSLLVSSVNVLFKKYWKILGVVVSLMILSPYYTNYFNTTLAFFGNTYRTVIIGFALLLVYLYTKTKEGKLFYLITALYYAGMAVSSSSFFLCAFITGSAFFYMCLKKEENWTTWIAFILSLTPLVHFALIMFYPRYAAWQEVVPMAGAFEAVLCLIAFLIRKHFKQFTSIMIWLFPIALLGLIVMSFLLRNGEFGYDIFFRTWSEHDMCNNFTSHVNQQELYRNIILYVLLAGMLVNFRNEKNFKIFLIILGLLFINPVVAPAVARFFTSEVYLRVFDLVVNPFVLIFLIANMDAFLSKIHVNFVILPVLGVISCLFARTNLTVPYSKTLVFKDEGHNWEYKVSQDTYDLYSYIYDNIPHSNDERPTFLSQDVGLKGYVDEIKVVFSSSDFRDSLADPAAYKEHYDLITMLYPEKVSIDYLVNDTDQADYMRFGEMVQKYDPDYVIIRTNLAFWWQKNDTEGWFVKPYFFAENKGQVTVEYENDTWTLLKTHEVIEEPESENEESDQE